MPDTQAEQFIGFPASLLGEESLRLPVLFCGKGLLAVDRPAGILGAAYPWYPQLPDVEQAINQQARAGKPELERLGVGHVGAVILTEPECAGITLFATNAEAVEHYRNAYGSFQMEATFVLLARAQPGEDERICELPIAKHRGGQPRMLISHTTGKRARTEFRKLETLGAYSLWEASTRFIRLHQVRLHGMETGINVVGDKAYGKESPAYLSKIKRGYQKRAGKRDLEERPLYDFPAIYLQKIKLETQSGSPLEITTVAPRKFEGMLKQMRKHG